ncbi:hypothetical protein R1flu_014728 [Riccia fluitans]|uniref:Uncharacterized protein n=1 Tax=Riccia fluitans TaxID=41844 RepID=A0ABD1YK17_9MARC
MQIQTGPWERFTIDVVQEVDRVVDLQYDIDNAKTLRTSTINNLGIQTCTDKSDTEQTMSIIIHVQYTKNYLWTLTTGLKVGTKIGSKLGTKTGVPFIGDYNRRVNVSTEITREASSEFVLEKGVTKKVASAGYVPLRVPPSRSLSAKASFQESMLEVPWTAKMVFVGTLVTRIISGVWKRSSIHNVTYSIEPPVKLPCVEPEKGNAGEVGSANDNVGQIGR